MREIYLEKMKNIVLKEKDSDMVELDKNLPQVVNHHWRHQCPREKRQSRRSILHQIKF